MFDFYVLVERPFRAVGTLAGVHWASVVPLDLVGSPPEPFLFIIITPIPLLNIPGLALQFGEARSKFVTLVEELTHLGKQDHVSKVEPTELMVVAEVSVLLHIYVVILNIPPIPNTLPRRNSHQCIINHTYTSLKVASETISSREGRRAGFKCSIRRTSYTAGPVNPFAFANCSQDLPLGTVDFRMSSGMRVRFWESSPHSPATWPSMVSSSLYWRIWRLLRSSYANRRPRHHTSTDGP
jgi:hypothetical protein